MLFLKKFCLMRKYKFKGEFMELVDVYNERCERLDYMKERKKLNDDEYRLSSFIWIINDKEEILLQQRPSNTKKNA